MTVLRLYMTRIFYNSYIHTLIFFPPRQRPGCECIDLNAETQEGHRYYALVNAMKLCYSIGNPTVKVAWSFR